MHSKEWRKARQFQPLLREKLPCPPTKGEGGQKNMKSDAEAGGAGDLVACHWSAIRGVR
jgi:hypothetical protein